MRQIDDAQIEAKLKALAENFDSLTREIQNLEAERLRIQGEYRTWESFKTGEAVKSPAEIEN
jgi:prefoldin subunit 5